MSANTIQPVESKTVSLPTQKGDNDTKLVQNIFSGQLEAMAKKMATQFNLPVEELMKMVSSHSSSLDILELAKKNKTKIKVKSKKVKSTGKTPITAENQCMARVWGSGKGSDQCKCARKDGDYCSRHAKQAAICEQPCMLDESGKKLGLFCGRIDQFQDGTTLPPFAVGGEIRIEWNCSEFKEAINIGLENGIYKRRNVAKTKSKPKVTSQTKQKSSKKKTIKVKSSELDEEDQSLLEQEGMEEDPEDSYDKVIAEYGLGASGDEEADEEYQNSILQNGDDVEEEELNVEQWEHNGSDYLVDPDSHLIYNENGEEIGKWGEGETKGAVIPKDQ
jgi:hypothetical protein